MAANHLVPALREGADAHALDRAAAAIEAERTPEIVVRLLLRQRAPFGRGLAEVTLRV